MRSAAASPHEAARSCYAGVQSGLPAFSWLLSGVLYGVAAPPEAGGEQVALALQPTDREGEFPAQLVHAVTAAVPQLPAVKQVPDTLVEIVVGSVGRQPFQMEPPQPGLIRQEGLTFHGGDGLAR